MDADQGQIPAHSFAHGVHWGPAAASATPGTRGSQMRSTSPLDNPLIGAFGRAAHRAGGGRRWGAWANSAMPWARPTVARNPSWAAARTVEAVMWRTSPNR